ncbi:hypothetical protein SCARR_00465 [Pontiella sulfatireligans]|uniref:Uncharacterized protein n=1 Tax=Pontiella sulfatireligans TaxID=2750658 RepID=A0A6C2UDX5_9BACT|nr:hypothetical protein SCARR_00465 [Pontiella sulfatireligans]
MGGKLHDLAECAGLTALSNTPAKQHAAKTAVTQSESEPAQDHPPHSNAAANTATPPTSSKPAHANSRAASSSSTNATTACASFPACTATAKKPIPTLSSRPLSPSAGQGAPVLQYQFQAPRRRRAVHAQLRPLYDCRRGTGVDGCYGVLWLDRAFKTGWLDARRYGVRRLDGAFKPYRTAI